MRTLFLTSRSWAQTAALKLATPTCLGFGAETLSGAIPIRALYGRTCRPFDYAQDSEHYVTPLLARGFFLVLVGV